jgi:hypothetical protein
VRRHRWSGAFWVLPAAAAASGGSPPPPVHAQRTWQADLSIQSLQVTVLTPGGTLVERVAVTTDSGAAKDVRVEIMLPIGVGVLRTADGCKASPSPVQSLHARVTCALGDVPARAERDVSIMISAPPGGGGGRARFAAFALSDTPDPLPSNNFIERVLP